MDVTTEGNQASSVAPFKAERGLSMTRAGNGGWLIWSGGDSHSMSEYLGAFTTPEEMIRALAAALAPQLSIIDPFAARQERRGEE